MSNQNEQTPATVEQIAAALTALGAYAGDNTPAEHKDEAARLGGPDVYRALLANSLLGVVQGQAILAEGVSLDHEQQLAVWEEQLRVAGAGVDHPAQRAEFLRWEALRIGTPLRLMAQHPETGPVPVAAAHAATALQALLGVIGASQAAVATGEVETLAAQAGQLREAREALENAIANTDILLDMLASVGM
ncbi:DUF6245 family protein [Streptomyces sp. NPDC056883]|uniref:DUF6245 family protein n=1 Tax=Streptomyces sp. NPDC056883 TaxID=3345959 RepID=UPI0036A24752